MAGAKIYNLQESLVSVRMGNEQQMRRGGLKNAMFEVDVQVDFYKMGFLSLFEMISLNSNSPIQAPQISTS
jgi:hypothetical protein